MTYTKRGRKFGRKRDQRKQLLRSLARSVILHERVQTTEARAKSIRPYIEKLVTRAKNNSLTNRRLLLSRFNNDRKVADKLLSVLGPRYAECAGGYTRVTKIEPKSGSGRRTAVIEFK